jgi:hypothetical protein
MAFSIFKSKLKLDKKPQTPATSASSQQPGLTIQSTSATQSKTSQPSPTRSLNSSTNNNNNQQSSSSQAIKGIMLPSQPTHSLPTSGSNQSSQHQHTSSTGSSQQLQVAQSSQLSSSSSHNAAQTSSSTSDTSSAPVAMDVMPEEPVSEEVLALRRHFTSLGPLSRRQFVVGDTLGTGTFGRVRLVT